MNEPVLEEVEGEDKVGISSLRVCRPRGESRVKKMGCLLGAARSHLFKDFSSDSILQIEEFIALTSLKLCRPPPGRRPENLCQFWAFLNLIRRRVNIKFSAPSKIKLRSLP